MSTILKNEHYIALEVTTITPQIYKKFKVKVMHSEESVNGHHDILLVGEFKDLKNFCTSEYYTCGDAEADLEFFNENIR